MPHNNRCRLYADDPVDEDDDNYGAAILWTDFADLPDPYARVGAGDHRWEGRAIGDPAG